MICENIAYVTFTNENYVQKELSCLLMPMNRNLLLLQCESIYTEVISPLVSCIVFKTTMGLFINKKN